MTKSGFDRKNKKEEHKRNDARKNRISSIFKMMRVLHFILVKHDSLPMSEHTTHLSTSPTTTIPDSDSHHHHDHHLQPTLLGTVLGKRKSIVLDGVDDNAENATLTTPITPTLLNGFVDSPVSLTERVKKRRYAKDALQRAMLCPVDRSSSELNTLQGLGLVETETSLE